MPPIILVLLCAAGLAAIPPSAAADDALLLPKGVLRSTGIITASTGSKRFDTDGKVFDGSNDDILTVSAAAEFGLSEKLLLGLTWIPGLNIFWDVGGDDNIQLDVPGEIMLGLKYGLVGEDARFFSERYRVALGPRLFVPTAGDYDASVEIIAASSGVDPYRHPSTPNAPAAGLKVYADYLFLEGLFFNAAAAYDYRFPIPIAKASLQAYSMANLEGADEVRYGGKYEIELEPRYLLRPAVDLRLGAGFPVNTVYEVPVKSEFGTVLIDERLLVTYGPSLSAFMGFLPIPIEARLEVSLAAAGMNEKKYHKFSFVLASYSRWYD